MREDSLVLRTGDVAPDPVVKMAQTFRTGTNDIDAVDFVELFLQDESAATLDELNDLGGRRVAHDFQSHTRDLPKVKVANHRLGAGSS